MIFLDETGKRWRAIKRSTTASITMIVLPLSALVTGAYLFNPGWATLALKPLQKPQVLGVQTVSTNQLATSESKSTSNKPVKNKQNSTPPATSSTNSSTNSSPTPDTASTTSTNSQPLIATTQPAPPTTQSSPSTSTPTGTTPTPPSSTSAPTSKSKNTDPGNSNNGLAHHFTTL